MRIYIAGPMTGLPQLNFPAFDAEALRLRAQGHTVVNPTEVNAGLYHEGWQQCLRRDIRALIDCQAVQLLPGYEWSRGARLELYIAQSLGLQILRPVSSDVASVDHLRV